MATEIVVPILGESIAEATVAQWLKTVGDQVEVGDPVVELETDKVTLEVNATVAGVISEIAADTGTEVAVGAILGRIGDGAAGSKPAAKPATKAPPPAPPAAEPAPAAPAPTATPPAATSAPLSPAVRKLVEENNLDPVQIPGTGKDGRLTKGDVLAWLESAPPGGGARPCRAGINASRNRSTRRTRAVMTRLRKRIAERLKEAQNTAAMLSTFNEVDMTEILALRARYRESFEKKHGVRLGFMSIFAKACIVALKEIPAVNAEIDGDDIIYKNHYDVGIAVGTPQGLVVPVIRDARFAVIRRDRENHCRVCRQGARRQAVDGGVDRGTFTITNGGVYGSLLSTPILTRRSRAFLVCTRRSRGRSRSATRWKSGR